MSDVPPQVIAVGQRPGRGRRAWPLLVAAMLLAGCAGRTDHRMAAPVYFPPPPSVPRIVHIVDLPELEFRSDERSPLEKFLFGAGRASSKRTAKPFGLAVAGEVLFVCDSHAGYVHVFDFAARRYRKLGARGIGRLSKPLGIAVDEQGNRYVADVALGEVVVFSPDDEAIAALPPTRDKPFEPVDVAVAGGSLFVVNRATSRVEVLDPVTGQLRQAFGSDELSLASGLSIGRWGRRFVADALSSRVFEYDADGRLVRVVGQPGDRAGEFARPKHMSVGPDGTLYVVDAGFQRVQMFDEKGRCLMLFGGPGEARGCLSVPAGVAIMTAKVPELLQRVPAGFDVEYFIFVSDQFGEWGVRVYAFGTGRRPDAG